MHNVYLVVDQNYLRSASLEPILVSRPDVCIVLSDVAMIEMTKSDQRELNVRASLEVLSRYPERVHVSRALGELLDYEVREGRPVTGKLLYRDATRFIRNVLVSVRDNITNSELGKVLNDPHGHLAKVKASQFDHEANKSRSLELVSEIKTGMPKAFARVVRGARATEDELRLFVGSHSRSLMRGVLQDKGYSREKALGLVRKNFMLLRYFYLKVWACLDWEKMGRLESIASGKVSNDLLDHEYVLTATFFNGILSTDTDLNRGYSFVSGLLRGYPPAA